MPVAGDHGRCVSCSRKRRLGQRPQPVKWQRINQPSSECLNDSQLAMSSGPSIGRVGSEHSRDTPISKVGDAGDCRSLPTQAGTLWLGRGNVDLNKDHKLHAAHGHGHITQAESAPAVRNNQLEPFGDFSSNVCPPNVALPAVIAADQLSFL